MELGPPDVMERKGALTLRSNSAYYGRPTLVSGWSQNRETEPKDYDIHDIPLGSKNLCQSTYWRFGTMDQKWITTYQDYLSSPCSKKEYKELEVWKPLLDEDGFHTIVVDRDTGLPETGFGAVLPRHPPEKFKMFMDTSYRLDYVPPYDYIPYVTPDTSGYSVVHRKCHSQFTDTADYRRYGINTWQDESGVYANTDLKQKVFPHKYLPKLFAKESLGMQCLKTLIINQLTRELKFKQRLSTIITSDVYICKHSGITVCLFSDSIIEEHSTMELKYDTFCPATLTAKLNSS